MSGKNDKLSFDGFLLSLFFGCVVFRMKQNSEGDRHSPEGERRSPSEDEGDDKVSSAEIHNADDFKEIFQPKNAICRSTFSLFLD